MAPDCCEDTSLWRAMAAIDIAMWDAAGKTAGVPVHKMLGGYRDRVPVYLAGGYYLEGKGLAGLAEEMRQKVALGARYVKMKIGGVPISMANAVTFRGE